MNIRTLRADEIECRVQQVKQNGCVLLLYKDARCDMRILDEVFQVDGWKREHQLIDGKLFCTVSIWSDRLEQWITKQDVGTESNTEKEKGQASDSFKRACFNLGIGRELYSAPFTWINLNANEVKQNGAKYQLDYKVKFEVKEIEYDSNREISKLVIIDQNGKERFKFNANKKVEVSRQEKEKANNTSASHLLNKEEKEKLFLCAKGLDTNIVKEILYSFGFDSSSEVTSDKLAEICNSIENTKKLG